MSHRSQPRRHLPPQLLPKMHHHPLSFGCLVRVLQSGLGAGFAAAACVWCCGWAKSRYEPASLALPHFLMAQSTDTSAPTGLPPADCYSGVTRRL